MGCLIANKCHKASLHVPMLVRRFGHMVWWARKDACSFALQSLLMVLIASSKLRSDCRRSLPINVSARSTDCLEPRRTSRANDVNVDRVTAGCGWEPVQFCRWSGLGEI